MKEPTTWVAAKAPTTVYWDISTCPVPDECDPRCVRPRIEEFLKYKGYTGPVTISVIGILTTVPLDVLRAVSSTGIVLHHCPDDFGSITTELVVWAQKNPPPNNIMVITHGSLFSYLGDVFQGYNVIRMFDPSDALVNKGLQQWERFLQQGTPEEDECCETGKWVCLVCEYDDNYGYGRPGQGFKSFTRHIASKKHKLEWSEWFPLASHTEMDASTWQLEAKKQPESKTSVRKTPTTRVRKQPESKTPTTRGKYKKVKK